MHKKVLVVKKSCTFTVSNAGPSSPTFGLFLFTAIQHIKPLKSFADLSALR